MSLLPAARRSTAICALVAVTTLAGCGEQRTTGTTGTTGTTSTTGTTGTTPAQTSP